LPRCYLIVILTGDYQRGSNIFYTATPSSPDPPDHYHLSEASMTEIRHANDHRSPSAEAALSGEHGSRVESIFIYNEKDVQDAKHFAADASKLLGKLEIDHKPGISGAYIITSA
jgi:hypothetical protein